MNLKAVDKTFLQIRCNQRDVKLEDAMSCVMRRHGDIWVIDIDNPAYPKPLEEKKQNIATPQEIAAMKRAELESMDQRGVGSELKTILRYMNIKSTPNCSCNKKAKIMNIKGIEWCKENKNLIVDWLQEEAEKRKLPFIRYGAKKILDLAIYRAEKKQKKK